MKEEEERVEDAGAPHLLQEAVGREAAPQQEERVHRGEPVAHGLVQEALRQLRGGEEWRQMSGALVQVNVFNL